MQENQPNFITLSLGQYEKMLRQAARMGAMEVLEALGATPNDLKTRAEMNRLHGKAHVTKLIASGRLVPHLRDGEARVRYSEKQYQSLIV